MDLVKLTDEILHEKFIFCAVMLIHKEARNIVISKIQNLPEKFKNIKSIYCL